MNNNSKMNIKIELSLPIGRKIMVGVCMAVLLSVAVAVGIIHMNNTYLADVLPAFENALSSRNYNHALEIYREINKSIVGVDPDNEESIAYESEILQKMEDIVSSRVRSIEDRIRYERYSPTADDRAFLEQMGELTGSALSIWLFDLSREFLLGTIEKPTLQYIFEQVGDYSNVVASSVFLIREIDNIEIARGDIQTAELLFDEGDYISAVSKYEYVMSDSQGFVYDYAQMRLEDLKLEMFEPIMAQCDHYLETYMYYTAEEILSDMARIFPDNQKVQAKLLEATSNTYLVETYTGNIEVVCVKPIIADTQKAFSAESASSIDSYYLTGSEFKAILEELYDKDYVLIDAHSLVDMSNTTFLTTKPIMVPEGKKPLIIVLENLNYTAYFYGYGLCSRLVFNDQGQVCGEYINESGQTIVSRNAEAIGILDAFVEENPDFSYNGVKGIISLSGYETIFGYVTNRDQVDDRNFALSSMGLPQITLSDEDINMNISAVEKVIDELKDTGWTFGSSTYGFINANSSSMETIQNDTSKWLEQVAPLTGDVDILVYPNGDFIKGSDSRCVYLKNLGFRIFFGVGIFPYYTYGDNYLYFDRAVLNGDTLRNADYSRLFDKSKVYDETRRRSLSS